MKEAAIKALTYPTAAYRDGFIPPSAINWNDADDNNAFHSKTVVMDLDGSISTEVAIIKNQQEYNDIVTMGLALSNDGKPVPNASKEEAVDDGLEGNNASSSWLGRVTGCAENRAFA